MRKAGLKRNARRNKQQPNGNNAVNQPESAPTVAENNAPPNATNPADPPTGPLRRKLSGEEAALTAKNYRLAKELVGLFKLPYSSGKFVVQLVLVKGFFVTQLERFSTSEIGTKIECLQ